MKTLPHAVILTGFLALSFAAIAAGQEEQPRVERRSPALDAIIAPDAKVEKLAEGFDWSEGPVWIRKGGYLLFSDVPRNEVLKWKEGEGVSTYLKPSGGPVGDPNFREPGSNGLSVDAQGRLVLCEHGNRRVGRIEPDGTRTALTGLVDGKRFNSPNDLAIRSTGDIYFTDPPYGLKGGNNSPLKEMTVNGVYRIDPEGNVTLQVKDLAFPNGAALSPDEKTLYIAQSDGRNPIIMAYPIKADGHLGEGRVFFDTKPLAGQGLRGSPDGLKTDVKGNVFSTGPGGVLVLSPDGEHLGTIRTVMNSANCAWGDDGKTLYITSDAWLLRVRTLTGGPIPGPQ